MRKDKFELPNVDSLIQLISQKLTKKQGTKRLIFYDNRFEVRL